MEFKKIIISRVIWKVVTLIIFIVFISVFFSNEYRLYIEKFLSTNSLFAPLIIILFRFIALVIVPIEAGPVALASLVVLPWWLACLYNSIGIILGDLVCFWISRRFREDAVSVFIPLKQLNQWQTRISPRLEFLGFIYLRLTTAVSCEYVSYAAGLTSISTKKYVLATIIGETIFNIIFFYVGSFSISYSILIYVISTGFIVIPVASLVAKYGITKIFKNKVK